MTGTRNRAAESVLERQGISEGSGALHWYEKMGLECWQIAIAIKLVILLVLLVWLHRRGMLSVAIRLAKSNWMQLIGLILLGFIALKIGGPKIPGVYELLGVPR
jgi:hypothetical protein